MKLILSCITKGEVQTRRVLDQLIHAGIAKHAIIVLHAGDEQRDDPTSAHPAVRNDIPPPEGSTVGAAASGSVAGGMFGWIVGFGVLSIPGALLGGAVGAATGAAIRASQHLMANHHQVPDEVQHHYASVIVDDHVAILVQVDDLHHYEATLTAFLDADGRHILTSRNNRVVAESDQLEALVHHPVMVDGHSERPTAV